MVAVGVSQKNREMSVTRAKAVDGMMPPTHECSDSHSAVWPSTPTNMQNSPGRAGSTLIKSLRSPSNVAAELVVRLHCPTTSYFTA